MQNPTSIDASLVLKALGAATYELVFVMDREHRYSFVNEAAARSLGFTAAAMIGHNWEELGLAPGREREFAEERERVMRTGITERREVRFPAAHGERLFAYAVTRIGDASDRAAGVIITARDVTDDRESERRLRDLADAMPQIVFSARADGVTDYFNRRWYEFTGFERITGDDGWLPILHPDDLERTLRTWRDAVRTGEPYEIEYRFFDRATGTYRWHLGRALPVRDAEGRILRWYGTCTDIEELKRSEEEVHRRGETLERQNFILRTLLDVSQILSAELDLGKLLQSVTDSATMLAGAEVGAFFFSGVDAHGATQTLWHVTGVPRDTFAQYPIPRRTDLFTPTFDGTEIVRVDDVREDSRYGKRPPFFGLPPGHPAIVSYLAVPVSSRSGEVMGALFFGHPERAKFGEDAERFVAGVASQAAIAIENARLLEHARDAAERLRLEEERYRTLITASAQNV